MNKHLQPQLLLDSLADLNFVISESGVYLYIFGGNESNSFEDWHGQQGRHLNQVLPAEKAQWFLEKVHRVLREKRTITFEYSLSANEVSPLSFENDVAPMTWFEAKVSPVKEAINGQNAVIWSARNITKQHLHQMELTYQSQIDELSGVFNRRRFFEVLMDSHARFAAHRTPCTMLLLDMDNLKLINDTFGHPLGDEAIRYIAYCCKNQITSQHTIGRLGGDEFAILLDGYTSKESALFARQLCEYISSNAPLSLSPISVSVGISEFTCGDMSVFDIYHRVDKALYQAKRNGRGCVVSI